MTEDRDAVIAAGMATLREIADVAEFAIERTVEVVRERTGATILVNANPANAGFALTWGFAEKLVRRPSVMDVRAAYVATALENQATARLAVARIIRRWSLPSDSRTLGNLAKVLPPDEAAQLGAALEAADLLSP